MFPFKAQIGGMVSTLRTKQFFVLNFPSEHSLLVENGYFYTTDKNIS